VTCSMNRDLIAFMREHYPQVAKDGTTFTVEDIEEEFDKSWILFLVKTKDLVGLQCHKTVTKISQTRSLMRYDISIFFVASISESVSGGLAGRPHTTVTCVFPVPVPCSHNTPLREQVVPCSCSLRSLGTLNAGVINVMNNKPKTKKREHINLYGKPDQIHLFLGRVLPAQSLKIINNKSHDHENPGTADSVEDETQNDLWNAERNPEWSLRVSFEPAHLKNDMNFDHRGLLEEASRVSSSTDSAAAGHTDLVLVCYAIDIQGRSKPKLKNLEPRTQDLARFSN